MYGTIFVMSVQLAFTETCNFFFFLIFQNESAAGNVIQLNKKNKPNVTTKQHFEMLLLN